jgi:hypothetical protein
MITEAMNGYGLKYYMTREIIARHVDVPLW